MCTIDKHHNDGIATINKLIKLSATFENGGGRKYVG